MTLAAEVSPTREVDNNLACFQCKDLDPLECNHFTLSVTNMGLGYSFNAIPMQEVMKPTYQEKALLVDNLFNGQQAFHAGNIEVGKAGRFEFWVGRKAGNEGETFRLSIHNRGSVADMLDDMLEIAPG